MTYSLGEVATLAKKAARGAGYPWGLAEEASMAVAWLCQYGIDGCAHLAAMLATVDGTDLAARMPDPTQPVWAGPRPLCPLQTGAVLSDRAHLISAAGLALGPLVQPVLLLPFLAHVARHRRMGVHLAAGGGAAYTDGTGLVLSVAFPGSSQTASLRFGPGLMAGLPHVSRADPDDTAWTQLETFAHRTYAPATEASRALGAGAGAKDTD